MKPITVYLLTQRSTGKQYVGQTNSKLEARLKAHLTATYPCPLLQAALVADGLSGFDVDVIAVCESREHAMRVEGLAILALGTLAPAGLNMRVANLEFLKAKRGYSKHVHTSVPLWRRAETRAADEQVAA